MRRQRKQKQQLTHVSPRIATVPVVPGGAVRVKRALHFQVDDDQARDVMQDAVFGPVRRGEGFEKDTLKRPKGTDAQVAGVRVAQAAYNGAVGQGARSVLPAGWTQGYALPGAEMRTAVAGQAPAEGQWDMDPSAMAIIDASFHRTVEQARAVNKSKLGETVLKDAYVRSSEFMREMLQAAKARRYAFEPREKDSESSLDPPAKVLPWATSVYYELAVRGLDRLWEALDITRHESFQWTLASAALTKGENMLQATAESVRDMGHRLEIENAIRVYRNELNTQAQLMAGARNHAARLIMLGSGLDTDALSVGPWRDRVVYVEGRASPFILSSMFFGNQHIVVESLLQRSPAIETLRYFTKSTSVFKKHAMFAYKLDRVSIRSRDDESGPLGHSEPHGLHDDDDDEYEDTDAAVGYRIQLPPAPRGYRRGNVLVQFISVRSEGGTIAETTDAVVAVKVPDDGVYRTQQEQSASPVDSLPANIILFLSEQDGEDVAAPAAEMPVVIRPPRMRNPAIGVFDTRASDDGDVQGEGAPRLAWQAVYDMAWLEWVSGHGGRLHPVKNRRFYDRLNQLYFRPWLHDRDTGPTAPLTTHIQITVELRGDPDTVKHAARAARRMYSQRLESGTRWVFPFSTPIPSAAVQKRFDLFFDNSTAAREDLPVAVQRPLALVDTAHPGDEVLFRITEQDEALARDILDLPQQEGGGEEDTTDADFQAMLEDLGLDPSDLPQATDISTAQVPKHNPTAAVTSNARPFVNSSSKVSAPENNGNDDGGAYDDDDDDDDEQQPIDLGFESEIGGTDLESEAEMMPTSGAKAAIADARAQYDASPEDLEEEEDEDDLLEVDLGMASASE